MPTGLKAPRIPPWLDEMITEGIVTIESVEVLAPIAPGEVAAGKPKKVGVAAVSSSGQMRP
jgi:hypothetical protein